MTSTDYEVALVHLIAIPKWKVGVLDFKKRSIYYLWYVFYLLLQKDIKKREKIHTVACNLIFEGLHKIIIYDATQLGLNKLIR